MDNIIFIEDKASELSNKQKFLLEIFTGVKFLSSETFNILSLGSEMEILREKHHAEWREMVGLCHDDTLVDDHHKYC